MTVRYAVTARRCGSNRSFSSDLLRAARPVDIVVVQTWLIRAHQAAGGSATANPAPRARRGRSGRDWPPSSNAAAAAITCRRTTWPHCTPIAARAIAHSPSSLAPCANAPAPWSGSASTPPSIRCAMIRDLHVSARQWRSGREIAPWYLWSGGLLARRGCREEPAD